MAAASPPEARVQRLVNKADFERLLAVRARVRSAHFAVHHLAGSPVVHPRAGKRAEAVELSTDPAHDPHPSVDNSGPKLWLGCMVPKRQARRAVTRNLIKRQMRHAALRHAAALAGGLWLLRMRAPFAFAAFPSAGSAALAAASRTELDALLSAMADRDRDGARA